MNAINGDTILGMLEDSVDAVLTGTLKPYRDNSSERQRSISFARKFCHGPMFYCNRHYTATLIALQPF